MTHVFANNAFSFLTGDIQPTTQDVTVRAQDAELFPQPDQGKGEVFTITIEDRAANRIEIAECFRRVGATLSVRRGREGTTAEVFAAGCTVSNRLTAGVIAGGLLGWSEFNRRYLGSYATQPTLDPLGFPLQRGALMYDLNTDALFVYTTDGWVKWAPSGDLQTGIPPGGVAGDSLTRNSVGGIEWRPTVDLTARDAAAIARQEAAQALAAVNTADGSAASRVLRTGDTMTGTLAISPGADAAGNASAVLVMGTRGTGAAHFRHTKAGSLFADIQSDADGIPRYVRYNTNGTVLSNKQILLTGDALGTGGGTVTGASIFSSTVEVNAPFFANTTGAIRDLTLLPSAGTEGGQVFFSPDTQGRGLYMDIATGSMRWFRHPDSAILATLNLATGQFNVNNLLTAGDIKSSFDVTATGAVYARSFRFIETGNDTGFDSSGDGYGTMLSNGQPVLQIQPGGNVYVWGNLTAFSDRRMKENIGIIEDPMAIIEQMVGVSFTKIGDPEARPQVGFIAQDVQDVLPHLIQSSHDGMLGVNYAAYVAVLNEGLKELALKVKRLEAHVHA